VKSIVIIGGGIAGLSAGIFAQKNGFKTTILEKHHTLGGECTGWNREGYHIDGCIHWFVGTKKGTKIRDLWDTVGALEGVDIHEPESFMAVEHEKATVHFYRDLNKMKNSWISLSPEDKDIIEEFCCDIKKLQSFSLPTGKPTDLMNIIEKIKYFASMKDVGMIMQKYSKISVEELSKKFKHPALKNAISSFMPEGGYSASSVIFPLGTFTGGQSSIPFGGSKALSSRMVEKYKSLGGQVETSCEIDHLEIDKNKVKKAYSKDRKAYDADYFIAACDAKEFYSNILKDNYTDKKYNFRFNNPKDYPLASNIYIGLGYEGAIEDIPRTVKFPVDSVDIKQNNKSIDYLQMTHYNYELDFAPENHTVITVAINQFSPELDRWEELVKDSKAYKKEKERIGKEVIKAIENHFPNMKRKLKLLDVATPQTYNRYCNAYRGAFMGFWPTLSGKLLAHTGKINGLDNIMLSGQWLQPPGGLPTSLITGKDTVMRICKREKIKFSYN